MRKVIVCFFLCLIVVFSLAANTLKSVKGELDVKGQAKHAEIKIDPDRPFVLQAYMLFKKSWRSIPVFFNEEGVWIDMGPAYRKSEYRINYQQ